MNSSELAEGDPGADGAQLWTALRAFSDADLERTKSGIRQYHFAPESGLLSSAGDSELAAKNSLQVELNGGKQHVRVDDFVHVFLDYLHRQLEIHADSRSSEGSTDVAAPASDSNTNMASLGPENTFEDEFPQLRASNNEDSNRIAASKGRESLIALQRAAKPNKRRITTTLLTPKDAIVVTRPMPAAIAFPPLGASESTRPPAWTKQSLLERRMGAIASAPAPPPTTPQAWGINSTSKTTAWGCNQKIDAVEVKTQPTVLRVATKKMTSVEMSRPLSMLVKKKTNPKQQLVQTRTKVCVSSNQPPIEAPTAIKKTGDVDNQLEDQTRPSSVGFQVNRVAAKLYGFLIQERFVKSTCVEIQHLINLLYRVDCAVCNSGLSSVRSNTQESKTPTCETSSEFCWRVHCLDFAELVFNEIEEALSHLGSDLLGLVKQSLRDVGGICSTMVERFERISQRREELRVAESARIGCQLPIEMKASAVRDFALPFCEETDSRLHYRTPAESVLYSNREKVRDGFLSLLRQFQQNQHSLVGIENASVAAAAIASARKLLADVSPENRWWFAKFFVLELVQVGSNPFGESDKDLMLKIMEDKLVVKNPDRLRKLHRRFSSQKPSNKSPQPHMHRHAGLHSSSNNNSKANGKGSVSPLRKNRQDTRTTPNEDDATKNFTATFDRMRGFFSDNQLFFFHFLHSCDSYEFSELVKHQLERQFYTIRDSKSPSADSRKDFTEVVLRLKVVTKFLGYLRFSPQWQVTSSIRRLSAQNAAFKAVEREGVSTLESARDCRLDVKKLLEDSILHASISKCIPWLYDYLSMLSLDQLSSKTSYFKQLVVLLHFLYRSSRLNSLGETGLYIALQIERIFHVLELDLDFLHSSDFQSRDLIPSYQIRLTLASEDDVVPEADAGEDHLPFLYSRVFIQNCVSELDDLRGFIQTRAQPFYHIKRKNSFGSVTDQAVTPIRKLRPLQVVIEDNHNRKTLPESGFAAPAHEEIDTLSEAVFKIHPKLKAVVEFVVETVTTDVCEHVMTHVVTPRADALVDRCALESGLTSAGRSIPGPTQDDNAATASRASFHMLITSKTRQEVKSALVAALKEALCLAEKRIRVAVPPFMPPSSHPTLIKSIMHVAHQRARGAIQALVPKSSQTEFVKRLAFRNKSLLKESGSAVRLAVAALPPGDVVGGVNVEATSTASGNENEEDSSQPIEEQRYRALRQYAASLLRRSICLGPGSQSLAEWEFQAAALGQCIQQFTNTFAQCVGAGDLSSDAASPLHRSGLVVWDVIWRVVLACLKFYSLSLETFVVRTLVAVEHERTKAIERQLTGFMANFASMLESIIHAIVNDERDDFTATSRLESLIMFVMDYVMTLPLGNTNASEDSDLVNRFAVPASSLVVAKLRAAVPCACPESNDEKHFEMNWAPLVETPKGPTVLVKQAQFRQDVWESGERLLR